MAQMPEMKVKWSGTPGDIVLIELAKHVRDSNVSSGPAQKLAEEVLRRITVEPVQKGFAYADEPKPKKGAQDEQG